MSNVVDIRTKEPIQDDPVASLQENLVRLNELHDRLKKMLVELEELVS